MTEWSMTSSAGASGLTLVGSPPRSRTASRMVARSTTQGTPVKSCISTRAGVNWISTLGLGGRVPAAERADVVGGDVRAVLGAQQVLQQDLQAVGQALVALDLVDPEDLVARVSDAQLALRTEGVEARHVVLPQSSGGCPRQVFRRAGRPGWSCIQDKPYVRLVKPASVYQAVKHDSPRPTGLPGGLPGGGRAAVWVAAVCRHLQPAIGSSQRLQVHGPRRRPVAAGAGWKPACAAGRDRAGAAPPRAARGPGPQRVDEPLQDLHGEVVAAGRRGDADQPDRGPVGPDGGEGGGGLFVVAGRIDQFPPLHPGRWPACPSGR